MSIQAAVISGLIICIAIAIVVTLGRATDKQLNLSGNSALAAKTASTSLQKSQDLQNLNKAFRAQLKTLRAASAAMRDSDSIEAKRILREKEIAAIQQKQTEEHIRTYDASIQSEGLEQLKTKEHAEQIEQLLKDNPTLVGTSLSEVHCSKSLCRIELSHDNENSQETFRNNALNNKPWNSEQFDGVVSENGEFRTYIYYSNEGQQLPPVKLEESIK